MSEFITTSLSGSGGNSWEEASASGGSESDSDFFKSSEFQSEKFFSSPPYSSGKDYCPYSLRQTQLSLNYQYDILLVYDPEENSFYVDKLKEYLEPHNLKIFDFVRDSPPGLPQRKVLQSALQVCRYTCIVITKKFISNFWLQLKTDMSIQDMLDNENKMYSVIVVVMDTAVKREHLPLDLATLSPLFCSEKFFENRIKLAFSKELPFPISMPLIQAKKPAPIKDSSEPYSHCTTVPYKPEIIKSSQQRSQKQITEISLPKPSERFPQEHVDSVLATSPMPSHMSLSPMDASGMHRGVSITVGSTGCREPQESSDPSLQDRMDAISLAQAFQPEELTTAAKDDSISERGTFQDSVTEGNFFSLSSCKEDSATSEATTNHEIAPSMFFDVGQPSVSNSNASNFSDLEISVDSIPVTGGECSEVTGTGSHNIETGPDPSKGHDSQTTNIGGDVCESLPAQLRDVESRQRPPKKSHSMLSLVGDRISRVKNSMSFRKKKH